MLLPLLVFVLAQAAKIDACSLISDADVRTVLDATVKERKPGTQNSKGQLLQQCYLDTGTARSISVSVGTEGKTAKKSKEAKERKERNEEVQEQARPIKGIGDRAFWSGSRIAGALYVFRRGTFIRVSVGGIKDEKERIEKSKQLAAAALARLPR